MTPTELECWAEAQRIAPDWACELRRTELGLIVIDCEGRGWLAQIVHRRWMNDERDLHCNVDKPMLIPTFGPVCIVDDRVDLAESVRHDLR